MVKQLLASQAEVNKADTRGVTPLYIASQRGHTEVVKQLLAAQAQVNVKFEYKGKTYTALRIAQQYGHAQIVTLLKKFGAKE